ncbi:MAG: hypothetical protein IT462_13745 [Planctomycetes bacterium]|nr:hypothetical protein [Planctomycetota bacterium]
MSEEFLEKSREQGERFQRDPLNPTVNTVYLRVKSDQVRGILGSKYAVPSGFVALLQDTQGKKRVLMPGEEATGDFTLHLLRDREVRMPFTVLRAKSKDGFDHSVSFELALTPDVAHKDAIEAFVERSAAGRRHLDWPLLKGEVQPHISAAVSSVVKDIEAAELAKPDSFERIGKEAAERSAEGLAKLGIGEVTLEMGRVHSEAWTQKQDNKVKVEQEREQKKAEQEIQAAMLKDQLGEALSRKELEDFLASAREDGMLKQHERAKVQIERDAELDRVQAEYQKQRHNLEATLKQMLAEKDLELDGMLLAKHIDVVKRMRDELADDRIEVYVNLIKDEKLKAELLHRLIQRKMTPEQLKAIAEIEFNRARQAEVAVSNPNLEPVRDSAAEPLIKPGETVRIEKTDAIVKRETSVEEHANVGIDTEAIGGVVEKTPENADDTQREQAPAAEVKEYVDSMHLTEVAEAEKNAEKTAEKGALQSVDALALVACGRHVYAIDPLRQRGLDDAPLDLNFDSGRLGSLRSVRVLGEGRDRVVLAGARNGVYTMLLTHARQAREFPIANNAEARTGINAAVLHQGYIYATHSEYGLMRWPYLQPYSPSTQVMPELTSRFSTTRGLDIFDNRLLFANGPTVMLLEASGSASSGLRVAARYEGTRHEVTALTHDGEYVLIADAAGEVFVWEPRNNRPPALAFFAGTAVADLAATTIKRSRKALIVALKRNTMPMLFRDGGQALEFNGPEPVRSCDALEGTVIGLSRDRMRVFAWADNKPDWPQWQFQFAEPVLDMQLVTPREIGLGAGNGAPARVKMEPSKGDTEPIRDNIDDSVFRPIVPPPPPVARKQPAPKPPPGYSV